ncbi:Sel1-repeat containing protein [Gracilaria domingensis]|nr:Sel1-repeat containing protein [Gracilaria domingensis]
MDVRAPTPLHSAAHLVPNGAVAQRLTTAQSVVEQSLRTAQHAIDNSSKDGVHRRRRLPTFSSDDIVGLARRRRSSDLSHLESEVLPSENKSLTKIDVWSVGWIMYYMATGKHPPNDAWARASIADELDWSAVPLECRPIIRMCIQTDKDKRASLREVKRKVDSTLQALMFAKGLALLDSEKRAAFMLLDKAVGIKSVDSALYNSSSVTAMKPPTSPTSTTTPFHDDSEPSTFVRDAEMQPLADLDDGADEDDEGGRHKVIGLNDKTRVALAALPLCVVRRVEWEAAAHYLRRSR